MVHSTSSARGRKKHLRGRVYSGIKCSQTSRTNEACIRLSVFVWELDSGGPLADYRPPECTLGSNHFVNIFLSHRHPEESRALLVRPSKGVRAKITYSVVNKTFLDEFGFSKHILNLRFRRHLYVVGEGERSHLCSYSLEGPEVSQVR
ncbi:hypothetical protein PISMIDRAFT_200547 [Pisolithus microcarpus 441]|uniref:Uncharacterized protein n=1 Tax=Pisolithus microcarpus 441 TaxID=765257 RepID=A0A0C9ZCZ6_9AGAM|nr:hypothetical protein BKA83DRAFT_200547 [Pisolithus microcarpus]KIK27161.1 hypothetical protein PISMIDRAFT_200547 [Pisolithus microcarpus 441]